jgi:hypothetical protein
VLCTCRFYDFLERRAEGWGIVLRQGVYDKDWLDPVAPDATLHLDSQLLNAFPKGYRHLACLQTRLGCTVKKDMPQSEGPEIEALYRSGDVWLKGGSRRHPGRVNARGHITDNSTAPHVDNEWEL